MVHQVCMEVPTWVKPKVTTRMMVIKIWDVVRDSKEVVIEEVIAEAEEALKETIRTVMATKTTTSRIRCSITNSTTTMVRWEETTTSSNSTSSRCQWAWVTSSKWTNSSHLFNKSWYHNSKCRCHHNKKLWCSFLQLMSRDSTNFRVMTETTLLVTIFTRPFIQHTEKNLPQRSLVCSLMSLQSITSSCWPNRITSKPRLVKPTCYLSRPSKTKSTKWPCSNRLLRTSEIYLNLQAIKIDSIR